MSSQEALRTLLQRQELELDKLTAQYVEVESAIYTHTDEVEYESLDQGGKTAYTRKLNELNK